MFSSSRDHMRLRKEYHRGVARKCRPCSKHPITSCVTESDDKSKSGTRFRQLMNKFSLAGMGSLQMTEVYRMQSRSRRKARPCGPLLQSVYVYSCYALKASLPTSFIPRLQCFSIRGLVSSGCLALCCFGHRRFICACEVLVFALLPALYSSRQLAVQPWCVVSTNLPLGKTKIHLPSSLGLEPDVFLE